MKKTSHSQVDASVDNGITRRNLIKGMGASLAAAPLMAVLPGCDPNAGICNYKAGLVLLGTTGGVTWF